MVFLLLESEFISSGNVVLFLNGGYINKWLNIGAESCI